MAVSRVEGLTDAECAELARSGDRIAFAELVRRYQDRLFRFVARMVGTRDDALDLVQDAFVKAWQAMPGWQPQATIGTWLFQIARNGAIDHLRRRKALDVTTHPDPAAEMPDLRPGPEGTAATAQQLRHLEAALARISAEHREILLLREVEQMTYEEIAATLAINTGTVKSRIARARAALLDLYGPRG
jgi:RNA polymerase sigma-70 factor (ECF subfamily)